MHFSITRHPNCDRLLSRQTLYPSALQRHAPARQVPGGKGDAPGMAAMTGRKSILQDRIDRIVLQGFSAGEVAKLDDKAAIDDDAARLFAQLRAGKRGAAGGKQIIHDGDALAGLDRIHMDLQLVGAVFKGVFMADRLIRELAGLAGEHKADVERARERGAENKAACTRIKRI